ncbi:hypothetical protein C7S18_06280 [Ahniella affigens]|uniref:Lipoprotein n=1 Tax=Ahniella affigens TaxID=2021234 RepID=A0A2P1PPQ6_9GAMM|nr:hypothetical protein C7S18_06280 [Ahniella affigens]
MLNLRIALLTFLSIQICACASVSKQKAYEKMVTEFRDRLELLSGAESEDCGSFGRGEDGNVEVACANGAMAAGKAFRLYGRDLGIDSILYKGVAVDASGKMFLVVGDSDRHGGGSWRAHPAVSSFSCETRSGVFTPENVFECVGRKEQ